jgi:glycosyltransferase involved in cell wall biosynthesis
MVAPKSGVVHRVLDTILTKPALKGAREVLSLTPTEDRALKEVAVTSPRRLKNGVGFVADVPMDRHLSGKPISVLYAARLHARKRPIAFCEAAHALSGKFPEVEWLLAGPDEGEVETVKRFIRDHGLKNTVRYLGALTRDEVQLEMLKSTIYVLPSLDEPFPMSLLEAMRSGAACVLTEKCGLAPMVLKHGAGLVVGNRVQELVQGVSALIEQAEDRARVASAGRRLVRDEFSIAAVVLCLTAVYRDAICLRGDSHEDWSY